MWFATMGMVGGKKRVDIQQDCNKYPSWRKNLSVLVFLLNRKKRTICPRNDSRAELATSFPKTTMCCQSPAKLRRVSWARWITMCDEGELHWSAIIYNTTTYGFPLKCWGEVIINEFHLLFGRKSAAYFNLRRVAGQSGLKYVTFHSPGDHSDNPHAVCPKWPFYVKFFHRNAVLNHNRFLNISLFQGEAWAAVVLLQ